MLTEVASGVFVTTSAFMITNTVVIAGADGGCLVIDPAVSVAELAGLASELAARGLHPVAGWSTHPHWDHVLWHAALGDVPRYAAPAGVVITETERDGMVSSMESSAPGHDLALFGHVTALDADTIPWHGPTARLVVHDAHAPGHGAVFLPDTGVFAVGDMISDAEIPLLDTVAGDPMGDYRTGLARLAAVPGVRHVIPGHGAVGDTAEFRRRIAADEAYLDRLALGKPFDDPRITTDWLRAAHDEHIRYVQQSGTVRPDYPAE
ncbi:MAG TPA: MBL fold metallo-hydrolase [Streptosporangiaceae bacterium]|nr:MBL fold metallo-hydrolase [Streptosporangiaceae bacterium]